MISKRISKSKLLGCVGSSKRSLTFKHIETTDKLQYIWRTCGVELGFVLEESFHLLAMTSAITLWSDEALFVIPHFN